MKATRNLTYSDLKEAAASSIKLLWIKREFYTAYVLLVAFLGYLLMSDYLVSASAVILSFLPLLSIIFSALKDTNTSFTVKEIFVLLLRMSGPVNFLALVATGIIYIYIIDPLLFGTLVESLSTVLSLGLTENSYSGPAEGMSLNHKAVCFSVMLVSMSVAFFDSYQAAYLIGRFNITKRDADNKVLGDLATDTDWLVIVAYMPMLLLIPFIQVHILFLPVWGVLCANFLYFCFKAKHDGSASVDATRVTRSILASNH